MTDGLRPRMLATSAGRCNTRVKSFRWSFKLQRFSWPSLDRAAARRRVNRAGSRMQENFRNFLGKNGAAGQSARRPSACMVRIAWAPASILSVACAWARAPILSVAYSQASVWVGLLPCALSGGPVLPLSQMAAFAFIDVSDTYIDLAEGY